MNYYVYILASKYNGTLYIGITSDLVRRVYEHKKKYIDGFSKQFDTKNLVYFEQHSDAKSAILREKQMKKWNRTWKIRLIERGNPKWDDLYPEIIK